MKHELVFPADCPDSVIRDRAIEKLEHDLNKEVMGRTGPYLKFAGLGIGVFLAAAWLDIVLGPVSRGGGFLGAASLLLSFLQLALVGAIVFCLTKSYLNGRQMQKRIKSQLDGIANGTICPLGVLGARRGVAEPDWSAAAEPKEIVAQARVQTPIVRPVPRHNQALAPIPVASSLEGNCVTSHSQASRKISLSA